MLRAQRSATFRIRAVPRWLSQPHGSESGPYGDAADRISHGTTTFAKESSGTREWNRDALTGVLAPQAFGPSMDIHSREVVGDIKYLWEPNRHLDLVTLAQAFALTGDNRYLEELRQQLDSWFDQCPYLVGPNWNSGLELAIRLINWSAAWQLIGAERAPIFDGPDGKQFLGRWLESVYQHVHFIRGHYSRFSSANNHLIGEAAGVFIAICTWPFWDDFRRWQIKAHKVLIREVSVQIATDGVDREQSVSYQCFVLEFLTLSLLAGRSAGIDFPEEYRASIRRMLWFLASLLDVHGNMPMVGDADDGRVLRLSREPDFCQYRSVLATGAILFDDPELAIKAGILDDQTRHLVGSDGWGPLISARTVGAVDVPRTSFPEGGYYVLGSSLGRPGEVRLLVDAGPLGYLSIAAHGHADALAVYLSVAGREFLIDPGTYTYHGKPEWRAYFRGTMAHNTVTVDGQDQSVQGGSFMWLRHANAQCLHFEKGEQEERFEGRHDGYLRLLDPVSHRRKILRRGCEIDITDILECKENHAVERWWHFSEKCNVAIRDGAVHAENQGITIRLSPGFGSARLYHGSEEPIAGWVSRRYDVKVPTTSVCIRSNIQGMTELHTTIECFYA
jgi:hypothetical protein